MGDSQAPSEARQPKSSEPLEGTEADGSATAPAGGTSTGEEAESSS
jgi:hypothetical protein